MVPVKIPRNKKWRSHKGAVEGRYFFENAHQCDQCNYLQLWLIFLGSSSISLHDKLISTKLFLYCKNSNLFRLRHILIRISKMVALAVIIIFHWEREGERQFGLCYTL